MAGLKALPVSHNPHSLFVDVEVVLAGLTSSRQKSNRAKLPPAVRVSRDPITELGGERGLLYSVLHYIANIWYSNTQTERIEVSTF